MNFICVLPIGDVAGEILEFAKNIVEEKFGYICKITEPVDISRDDYDATRMQFYSTRMIKKILEKRIDNAKKIIGITTVDLFVPVLTFVFGQAQLDGKAAVVSIHRLRQEFYGLPANQKLLYERLGKEITHELGHTFGLIHCENPLCVMHFSNSIREIDVKESNFCSSCAKILRKNYERKN